MGFGDLGMGNVESQREVEKEVNGDKARLRVEYKKGERQSESFCKVKPRRGRRGRVQKGRALINEQMSC